MKLDMIQRIRRMKVGDVLVLKTDSERKNAIRAAGILRKLDLIDFDVVTKQVDKTTFKVAAI